MKCLILANGDYGEIELYKDKLSDFDKILCADGGANYAYSLDIIPDYIIGDMDSIDDDIRAFYQAKGVVFKKYPRQKDFTDTQLVIHLAEELGAKEILFCGSLGTRLDHTLSNLYSGINTAINGIKVTHYNPKCSIHIVAKELDIEGNIGETVSVLALTDIVTGLSEMGVEYPLEQVSLEKHNPYAISNILSEARAKITVDTGVIAVFHYHEG